MQVLFLYIQKLIVHIYKSSDDAKSVTIFEQANSIS